jgi:hypothetical protein
LATRLAAAASSLIWLIEASPMPVDLAQARDRRVNDFGERAELFQQRFRQRLGVAPGQGREQRHLQQFIIAERLRPGRIEALAQPFAVAVIMRRLGGLIRGSAGLGWHRT